MECFPSRCSVIIYLCMRSVAKATAFKVLVSPSNQLKDFRAIFVLSVVMNLRKEAVEVTIIDEPVLFARCGPRLRLPADLEFSPHFAMSSCILAKAATRYPGTKKKQYYF